MLVWIDGFSYSDVAFMGLAYPSLGGTPLVGQPHELTSRSSVGGSFWIETPVLPSSDRGVVGMLLFLQSPAVSSGLFPLLTFKGLGVDQVTCWVFTYSGTAYLQVNTVEGEAFRVGLPLDIWFFLEVSVSFSQGEGRVIVRLNGVESRRVEGLQTESGLLDRGFDSLRIDTRSYSGTIRISDLYVANGTSPLLGKVEVTDRPLGQPRSVGPWAETPAPTSKWRVVVMAGQSNMAGRNTSPFAMLGVWTSPNPRIRIWDRITGPAALRSIQATVNTAGQFLLPAGVAVSGPEMRFAERVSNHYLQAGSDVPNIMIVKGAQDGSFLAPFIADYTWDRSVTGNLYNGTASPRGCLLVDIVAAVTSIGGWSAVERVDFMWYQGESDAIFESTAKAYGDLLRAFFDDVAADLPAPVHFHVVQIHKDLAPSYEFASLVREAQRNAALWDDTSVVSSDSASIASDLTHLEPGGYDEIGDLLFESWLRQMSTGYLKDFTSGVAIDSLYWGASSSGSAAIHLMPTEMGSGPLLAVRMQAYDTQSGTALPYQIDVAGLQVSYTPSSGSLTRRDSLASGVALPESLIDLTITV